MQPITRRAALIGGGASAGALAFEAPRWVPGEGTFIAPRSGQRRTLPSGRGYLLTGVLDGPPRPLMVGLHPSGHTSADANSGFWNAPGGWGAHATAHGYTLALGEGVGGTWNVGGAWPVHHGQDDLAYLAEIVSDVQNVTAIDSARRFVAGASAGAALAWTACVERPDLFAAGVGASGWAAHYPDHPIDFWHNHGLYDPTVPLAGGIGTVGMVFPPAVREAERAPRGSRVCLNVTRGGHTAPGWMANRAWTFCTVTRMRP